MNAKYIVCALFCSFLAPAQAKFYDGQQLYLYAQEYKKAEQGGRSTPDNQLQAGVFMGYVASMIDAYGNEGAKIFCQPNGRLQTYADVVYKYLNDNPDQRVNSAESLVIAAMQASFRCKEPPKLNGNK
ncbi:Rap1a/Tai family immunity protein [Citrobacter freundii]|uniref:Rap1a/Tai family immunity protein n=1 Tax=Citrobacter freundii TaxID=546 RepID=UPI001C7DE668|nr:Rap1a/Tai family immunity protein [Citrobacter freundii]MDV1655515.1 Rap1a/Tai family immunity protein [Citrobacter freundii]MEB0394828.1 Rap1a/Tai family immunity protein [Citrobacter freundii]